MSPAGAGVRIGVDTGGTFTDVVALTPHGLVHQKVPSSPEDPGRALLEGVAASTAPLTPSDRIAHGTTVATNVLLTGAGAAAVLLTTAGFEDVLEIGRQDRPALYDLAVRRPDPIIPASHRVGVPERVDQDGAVLRTLEESGISQVLDTIARLDPPPQAVAVCLLHAYAAPAHEERLLAALQDRFPAWPVTLSSRLIPLFREYERTSTVCVNAVLQPVMGHYLRKLRAGAGGAGLRIIASSGGALSADRAADEPVHTLLSGPAAGVAGALAVARRAGFESILTFDMGGTSTDVALCDGRIEQTAEGIVAGHPVQVPQVDLHTVGAGGGSLARVDLGGALVVGPGSAGADPGPLAYGRRPPGPGGEGTTVTDANLLLGRLPPGGLLGGRMPLDAAAARRGIELLAAQAEGAGGKISAESAAEGVVKVAVTAMAGALRRISVERGKDPRGYTLVAFGGAGGMHAVAIARDLGIPRVLIPREPGLLSAVGTLVSGLRIDRARTVLGLDPEQGSEALGSAWRDLEEETGKALQEAGAPAGSIRLERHADLRYRGQSFELTVPVPDGTVRDGWAPLRTRFAGAHAQRYGYDRPGVPVEIVSIRVEGHGPPSADLDELLPAPSGPKKEALSGTTRVRLIWEGQGLETPLLDRADLVPGERLRGPVLIHEFSSTTVLPPDTHLEVGPYGDLIITV